MTERLVPRKDPESIQWMPWIPWADRLGAATISTSSWITSGVNFHAGEISGTSTRVRLSGGSARRLPYEVTNRITTSTGETLDWSFNVRVVVESIDEMAHDPNASEILAVDWSHLLDTGVTLTSVLFTMPSGLTKVGESTDGQQAQLQVSGGTAGTRYSTKCQITTSDGQTLICRFDIVCRAA